MECWGKDEGVGVGAGVARREEDSLLKGLQSGLFTV